MGFFKVDEDQDAIIVVLDKGWVHALFVAPVKDFSQIAQKWESAGFRVVHEWGKDLQYRVNGDFELLPEFTQPAQVFDKEAKTYALSGADIKTEPFVS